MIKVENLGKKIKKQVLWEDVNMELEDGEICGLVGYNGSGKTVLMKCMTGFMKPTTGRTIFDGKVVGEDVDFPDSLGLMLENPSFIPYMSGYQNLKNLAMIKNKIKKEKILETMEIVGLDPLSKKMVANYSLGMKQRLGIAQAIMEEPGSLILDEPFNGLDENGVNEIRKLFLQLKESGTTILLASHMKEDIQILCDKIYKIKDCAIVAL